MTRTASVAAKEPPKGAPGVSTDAPPGDTQHAGEDEAVSGGPMAHVQVAKVISIDGDHGSQGGPFRLPAETSKEDSGMEPSEGDSAVLDPSVLIVRNRRAMEKHRVVIRKSQAKCNPGIGLFAKNEILPVGLTIPAKGPWFDSRPRWKCGWQHCPARC